MCNESNKAIVHTETFGLEICPAGHYCPAGAAAPTPCPAGTYSVPALHVKRDDTVCYGVLAPGAGKNSININYNGQVYHMAD